MSTSGGAEASSASSIRIETAMDVERIFLRLVNANTDAKLQVIADRHLCDVLEFAGRKQEHAALVTEFLTHFNRVTKSNHAIRLPVSRLLELFQSDSPTTSNFSLIYLKFAKDRIGGNTQLEVLPVYLKSFRKKPENLDYIYDIFSLCLPGLHELANMEKRHWPAIKMSAEDTELLARCFYTVFVFQARSVEEVNRMIENIPQAPEKPKFPGISLNEFMQLGKKIFNVNLNLTETKVKLLKVLGKELLDNKIAFPLMVVASASRLNEVDDLAEGLLKKIPTEVLVNEIPVVDKLMQAYLGSDFLIRKPTDPARVIEKGSVLVQAAVLPWLTKSSIAPSQVVTSIKICLDGCVSPSARVQTSAMNYFNLVAEQMPPHLLPTFAQGLFNKLRVLVRPQTMSTLALCGIYRCLAIFGKRLPVLVLNDTTVVTKMFADLENENNEDVSGAIVSCLTTWLPIYLEAEEEEKRAKLREVISEYIQSERPNCRLAALKYAEALIGENDMDLRWILIQSSGDQRDSIRSEALRQLEKSLQKPTPPTSILIGALWSSLQRDYRHIHGGTDGNIASYYNNFIHQNASKYLYAVLETVVMKEPAHLRIVEGDDHWMTVAPHIVKFLHEVENIDMIEKAAEMTLYAAVDSTDVHLVRIASCFLAAYRSFPQTSAEQMSTTKFQFAIQPCAQKLRDSTRMEFSNALAYLLSAIFYNDQAVRLDLFTISKEYLVEKEIPGLAFTCASTITPVLGAQFTPPVSASEFIQKIFLPLIKNGYSRPTSTLESTLGALVFILQNNLSALDYNLHKETIFGLIESCEKIAVSRQDSFTQKTREHCAKVIGLLSGSFTSNDDNLNYQLSAESLIRFGEGPPQQELQLVVGEAIVDAILGSWALSKRDYYVVDESVITLEERLQSDVRLETVNHRIIRFLKETLEDKKTNKNQHFRKAELIWLLILVQSFSRLKASVLKNAEILGAVQQAFADGLTENDEFSQDISAKGMGVVYGLADGSLKKGLVKSLMDTLSDGKRSKTKVENDTKLFEQGQLGTTPTGGKLTTYQELLTLASDLNQPDLVYKFMQLARHNAIWNSKMGAAHGFGALLENAKEEIEPYFKQLVPKLFRFRYDPDLKVQNAMKSIWAILTADRKNVVDEFANEIAAELLPALTDKEYRVRESACLALSDLLRGHDTIEMHAMIPQYLEDVLRVRDDVKESVREAANRAADALSKLIVRLGSSNNLEKANQFLSIALPAVISQGIINSTVKANTLFCLKLVLELTKSAGKQLKPYLVDLIPLLMDSVSENETPLLNYLAVRSNQQEMEVLDDARASYARSSPMMTAVNDLLPHIDSEILIALAPRIADILRSSVGTTTRSAAAQFVTQLALRAPQLLYDHTAQCDKLFSALIPGVRDRNPSIRKQFANAMSYLAKFSSANQMNKLIKTVVTDLLGSDEDLKISSCYVISNLAANSAEMLKGYASQIVPYVLLEKCKEVPKDDEAAREKHDKWCEVWSELVPSTDAAARLYKSEILDLGINLVTNNEVWAVRKQAAVMIGILFERLQENAEVEIAKKASLCLLKNLNGRIWDGKIEILKALTATFEAGASKLRESLQQNESEEIKTVLQREASKKNADYAYAGLSTLATYSVIMEDVESAIWLADKVESNILKLTGVSEKEDSDDDMEGITNLEKEIRNSKLVTLNLTALAISLRAFNSTAESEKTVKQISEYVTNPLIAWKSKQLLFSELSDTLGDWRPRNQVNIEKLVENLLEQADELCSQQKITVASYALLVVLKLRGRPETFGLNWNSVTDRVNRGTAGQTTGLGSRFEEVNMETD
uniref:Proteasome-associated protein ECM29 homolog n=1 Tax=Caenorhabditis tropicalis TaxID=1561998 RepID=A0A1I7TME9_9PELO